MQLNKIILISLKLALLLSYVLSSPTAKAQQQVDEWALHLTPYAWLAGVDGSIGVRERSADFDQSFGDILEKVDLTFMTRAEVKKGNFFLTGDIIYLDLEADGNIGPAKIETDLQQVFLELGGGYRFYETEIGDSSSKLSFDLLGGARYFYGDVELKGPFDRNPGSSTSYWEPFVGPRMIFALDDQWSFGVRADFGGFDVGEGSKFTWQLISGVTYQATELVSLSAGYKVLDREFESSDTYYNDHMEGAILGLGFSF